MSCRLTPLFPAGREEIFFAGGLAASGGWCRRCRKVHALPAEAAARECLKLMETLALHRRIDWSVAAKAADPRCHTDPLFGTAGGKMFGVLCCRDDRGVPVVLRAFSGQFNGVWRVEGWVDPIFDVPAFTELIREPERAIKRVGTEMALLPHGSDRRHRLRCERRVLSRQLMVRIHALYELVNFRGEQMSLIKAFLGTSAPPSGTGDCCAPKLLHQAAVFGLRPESLAEFFWGRSNPSATRLHGRFYPACAHKCAPILGFQLCGLA